MKYVLSFLLVLAGLSLAQAQLGINAPTGLSPRQDLEIYTRNGFLVQQKFILTTADPNASINTLNCATSPPSLTASAGILKDPGGDGNYPASLTCTQIINPQASVWASRWSLRTWTPKRDRTWSSSPPISLVNPSPFREQAYPPRSL